MAKPNGPRCNIDCTYCYYLEKEKLFEAEKKFRMSDSVLENYVRQLIETSVEAGMQEVGFYWQGGEPTLPGIDYYRNVLALQQRYKPAGVTITNALQTNGLLLDDDWGRFFHDNGFLVGISIDGPAKEHNRYRVDRMGKPTASRVLKGLEVLQTHNVNYNVLTTVHRANGTKGKTVYRFLRSLGVDYIQFIPIVERLGSEGLLAQAPQMDADNEYPVTDWSVPPRIYGKFLCDVFDTWFKQDIGKVFVQHFDVMLQKWLRMGDSLCLFAETCGGGLALEHDGSLYSCDHYVYPEYSLGNIMQTPLCEMVWSQRQIDFGNDKRDSLTEQCKACTFRFACNGGCPKHRFIRSKQGEAGHNYFCEGYMQFFSHAASRLDDMAKLVAMGRTAAEAANQPRKRESQ